VARQIEAVYEQGILRPVDPLILPEHQRVLLTLEEQSPNLNRDTAEPVSINDRREELRWLAKESGPYAGEWVALEGPHLIAHGTMLADVRAAAAASGIREPFFARVPKDKDVPFGGW
jgi:predicted DNA-binding antitoxin AbrB/MazE fold protein